MTRTYIIRANNRAAIRSWIDAAEEGHTLTIRPPNRTDEQNNLMWHCLGRIAKARPVHNGVKMNPDLYKAVFMQALGAEMVFLPTLEGDGVFPLGYRSSKLSKAEFSGLMDVIFAFAAREGISLEREAA